MARKPSKVIAAKSAAPKTAKVVPQGLRVVKSNSKRRGINPSRLEVYLGGEPLVTKKGADGSITLWTRKGRLVAALSPASGSKLKSGDRPKSAVVPPKVAVPGTKKPVRK